MQGERPCILSISTPQQCRMDVAQKQRGESPREGGMCARVSSPTPLAGPCTPTAAHRLPDAAAVALLLVVIAVRRYRIVLPRATDATREEEGEVARPLQSAWSQRGLDEEAVVAGHGHEGDDYVLLAQTRSAGIRIGAI